MELRSLLPQNESSIRKPLSSFTLSMVGAVSAELILGGFLDAVTWTHAFGRIGIIAVALFVIHRFALESLYAYKPRIKDLITLTCVLLGSITFVALGKIVCLSVHTYASVLNLPVLNLMASEIGSQGLYYAIPFSAGGILVQAIMGIEFALVFGMGLALIVGVYLPEDITLPAFVIATAFVGSLGMLRVRSRQAYIKAGVNVAIITLVFSLARIALKEHANIMIVLTAVGVSIIGGILTTFVISGIAPAIEKLGGYVTDISLLEIATLDHPLLKQLSVQAPGTWNHSMVMGMMVESAAQAINANPVLGRVACYYHDVGKSKNPLYFIENQGRGENRHDKLSPSMSALIIKAHVKDGIKMAEEARLPQAIIDMIPQHHGTSLIEYFYDKACKEAAEANSGKEVDETVYRYPGPRPQTKEAGIIMLADGIEAACRTISEPTMDRIQGLVQKMVNKVFASGELEECELTLRELHEIAKCFTRVLTGIYHSRISYSEPAEKTAESDAQIINTADTTKTEPNESHSDKKDGESSSPEDLKRLGI